MLRVDNLDLASDFYARVCGLSPLWQDETSVGMGLPETDAELVLHTMDLPPEYIVHYLVDNVLDAVSAWQREGCTVREEPFEIAIGWCAVLEDPFGNPVCILDLTKSRRTPPV